MTPAVADIPRHDAGDDDDEPHVIVVIRDVAACRAVADKLRDTGFHVTTASSYGLVEILLAHSSEFELLVTAQSFGEMGQFGLPQLARSVRPDLPILVLEIEAADGSGVVNAVRDAIRRWPLRERPQRCLH